MDKTGLSYIPFEAFSNESGRRYVYVTNMKTGISRWSKSAVEYFGLPGEYMENVVEIWGSHIHPSDKEMFIQDIGEVLEGKKTTHSLDYRAKNKDGDYVVCTCRGKVISPENEDYDLFVGTIENFGISDYIDSVTGLNNVYSFLRDMQNQMEAEEYDISLFAVAINHFADINNMYGYTKANRIITAFSEAIRSEVGTKFRIYRLDGVKFCVAFRDTSEEEINEIYQRLKSLGHKGIDVEDIHTNFTLSGGVVFLDESVSEFSIQASISYVLDQSKYKRHGELVIFGTNIVEKKRKDLAQIDTLRNCVYNGMEGFYMCYQPIIDAETEAICGMESLVRWKGEIFGEIPPGIFIPWLENDPCFFRLGQWIMKKALTEAKPIVEANPKFIVNVNVSVEQIERSGFRNSVHKILEETGFPPENMCMELTERVMSLDINFLKSELDYFRKMGIKIALDDFGTGVSSLSLLLDLSVDCLKIDRNFVMNITTNSQEQLMVNTIASCADGLGLEICVEGVETEEMKNFLKKYHIQKFQGYYYSKPVVLQLFMDYMENYNNK